MFSSAAYAPHMLSSAPAYSTNSGLSAALGLGNPVRNTFVLSRSALGKRSLVVVVKKPFSVSCVSRKFTNYFC